MLFLSKMTIFPIIDCFEDYTMKKKIRHTRRHKLHPNIKNPEVWLQYFVCQAGSGHGSTFHAKMGLAWPNPVFLNELFR